MSLCKFQLCSRSWGAVIYLIFKTANTTCWCCCNFFKSPNKNVVPSIFFLYYFHALQLLTKSYLLPQININESEVWLPVTIKLWKTKWSLLRRCLGNLNQIQFYQEPKCLSCVSNLVVSLYWQYDLVQIRQLWLLQSAPPPIHICFKILFYTIDLIFSGCA